MSEKLREDQIKEYGSAIGGRIAAVAQECVGILKQIKKGFSLFKEDIGCQTEPPNTNGADAKDQR